MRELSFCILLFPFVPAGNNCRTLSCFRQEPWLSISRPAVVQWARGRVTKKRLLPLRKRTPMLSWCASYGYPHGIIQRKG